MLDYILPIAACFYALLQLAKDWEKHETRLRRTAALVLVLLLGVGSAINTYYSKSRAVRQHSDDQAKIAELKKAVEVSSQDQKTNTEQFVTGFGALSKQVADLQTQVKTEKLQSRLAALQGDLQKTQRALAPGPKAELTFSFVPFDNPPLDSHQKAKAVTETTLPLNPDGNVHVEITILNLTEVDVINADVNLQICDQCKYAKEPEGTTKDPALFNQQTIRILSVPHLGPLQSWKTISLDVIPPPAAKFFLVGYEYRCQTCVLSQQARTGTVHVLGR
jgi:hypothetical protein